MQKEEFEKLSDSEKSIYNLIENEVLDAYHQQTDLTKAIDNIFTGFQKELKNEIYKKANSN
jgi:hypothetical protein